MKELKKVNTTDMTKAIISDFIIHEFIFAIILFFLTTVPFENIDSLIGKAVAQIIRSAILAIIVWKCTIQTAFQKKTITSTAEIPKLNKNLLIFTIVICLFSACYDYYDVNKTMNEYVENSYEVSLMTMFYSSTEKEDFKKELKEEIKSEFYPYFALLEIGTSLAYLGSLYLVKNDIEKNVNSNIEKLAQQNEVQPE